MFDEQADGDQDKDRRSCRIDRVLADFQLRIKAGDPVSTEALIARHHDLMPELGAKLHQVLRVQAARRQAGQGRDRGLTAHGVDVETQDDAGLQIRCPHCHNPIELCIDAPLHDILCEACGSHFNLVDESVVTHDQQPLKTLGHFELVERLGVGAFGAVWKARDTELDRTVAVKVPRRGQLSSEEMEKFVREARTAAQLKHPNIVSVHEIGRSDDSIYIVCDLIRGISLSTWQEHHQPTAREAASMCATIAEALHHAHEQGVVHRDLKPQNVMVDAQDQPHVMDFGLARRETGEITMTVDGQVLGTPAYMSPEQARGEAHEADRRSDVYSLGVMLFELLTGELPFRGSVRMLIHQVLHDDPPAARKLNSQVPRDLETICQKCMEKDPRQRYQTGQEVAEDLRRHLHGEPIMARPLGRSVRLWRWCRRKPLAASFIATAAVGLTIIAMVSTSAAVLINAERHKEQLAREKADQALASRDKVVELMIGVFQSPDPERDGRKITVGELLDASADRLSSELADEPLMRATLMGVIGSTYRALGLPKEGLAMLEPTVEQYCAILGEDAPETLHHMNELGRAYQSAGELAQASSLFEQTLEKRRRVLGEDDPQTLSSMNNLALVYGKSGRLEEALPLLERTLEKRRRVLGENHPQTLSSMNNLAGVLDAMGRYGEALSLFEETLTKTRATMGDRHPDALNSMNNMAYALMHMDRLDEAIPLFEAALENAQATLGDTDPNTVSTIEGLGHALYAAGRPDEALLLFKDALEKMRDSLGDDHPATLRLTNNLAAALHRAGRFEEALPLLERVLEFRLARMGESHADTLTSMNNLAATYEMVGRLEDAEQMFEQVLEKLDDKLGEGDPKTQAAVTSLAAVYRKSGKFTDAESLLLELHPRLMAREPDLSRRDQKRLRKTVTILVTLYNDWEKPDEAAKWRAELDALNEPSPNE